MPLLNLSDFTPCVGILCIRIVFVALMFSVYRI